jgi:hypothetical protein
MKSLKGQTESLFMLDEKEVPWFPRHISDLDHIADRYANTEMISQRNLKIMNVVYAANHEVCTL